MHPPSSTPPGGLVDYGYDDDEDAASDVVEAVEKRSAHTTTELQPPTDALDYNCWDGCEEEASLSDYVDYEEDDSTSESEKDAERLLLEMGFNAEHVAKAIEACGKENSIFILSDFIEAHYGTHKGLEVCDFEGMNKHENQGGIIGSNYAIDAETKLLDMGYPHDHVADAIKACGNESTIFELSDFIQAHFGSQEESENMAVDPRKNNGESSNCLDDDGNGSDNMVVAFKKLQQMGFTSESVERAAKACGNCEFDELLEYLVDGAKVKLEPMDNETNIFSKEAAGSSANSRQKQLDIMPMNEIMTPMQKFCSSTSSESEDCTLVITDWEKSGLKAKRSRKNIAVSRKQMRQERDLPTCVRHRDMKGFGLPGTHLLKRHNQLNRLMEGPPYFYFENVATMPKSQWDTISRHFNGIEPEFVDSRYFSASRRPRGYVHNLPLEGRKQILPTPPMTIEEALPQTRRYWPLWDTRNKINCLHTRRASEVLCNEIRTRLAKYEGGDLPLQEQQFILHECRKWNLVWVGPGQVAPLEPHEMELLLGFDKDHTRGACTASDRYQALGNSFQINTVAYHLSVLKPLYHKGLNVLSLFSGIGGAEVALHKLGIFLRNVVTVEIDPKVRSVIASWWKKSGQKGQLILKDDARNLTNDVLDELVDQVGGFDLIIGGSPCNNLSGNNRVTRTGLDGKESSVFYEFPRILNAVKQIMLARRCR